MKFASTLFLLCLFFGGTTFAQSDYFDPYNAWSDVQQITELADIDGDGDVDAFATNTAYFFLSWFINRDYLKGIQHVDFIPNTGTNVTPDFSQIDYHNADFQTIIDTYFYDTEDEVYTFNGILRFADMDDDNDLDLFMATNQENGMIRYFKNIGSSTSPNFTRDETYDFSFTEYIADFQLIDLNNDGQNDLVINSVIFDYSCSLFYCNINYLEHSLSIAKNENGFSNAINIEHLFPQAPACNCEIKETKIQNFAIRAIGNVVYLTFERDYNIHDFDQVRTFRFNSMYNAPLTIDWLNSEAFIDTTHFVKLPFYPKNRVAVKDINNDGMQDIVNGNLQLLSTKDPGVLLQTALNPYNVSPYVTSLPENYDSIYYYNSFVEGESITLINIFDGMGSNLEILDFNNNGTLDLIGIEDIGLTIIDDFENQPNTPKKLMAFKKDDISSLYFSTKGLDFSITDLNNDGDNDVVTYELVYNESTDDYTLTISLNELQHLNDSLYFDSALVVFEQKTEELLPGATDLNILAGDFNGDNIGDVLLISNVYSPLKKEILLLINVGTDVDPDFSNQNANSLFEIDLSNYENQTSALMNYFVLYDYDADGDHDLMTFNLTDKNGEMIIIPNVGDGENMDLGEAFTLSKYQASSELFNNINIGVLDYGHDGVPDLLVRHFNIIAYYFTPNLVLPIADADVFNATWKENSLFINPTVSPFLLVNEGIVNSLDTVLISLDDLALQHLFDNDLIVNDKAFYSINKNVSNGVLINTATQEDSIIYFTQADLANGNIAYVSSNQNDDEFIFTVKHGAYKLMNQTFEINANTTAIHHQQTEALYIYPNPTKDYIVVDHPSLTHYQYHIYAANGQLMLSGAMSNFHQKIDVKELPKGIYQIEISAKDKIQNASFIKN
ncbi:MAG: T9SS type A sorting domain-containing protein [Chitinophagales bacterium]